MELLSLAKKIIDGHRIKRGDDLSLFLSGDIAELQQGADLLRQHFCGDTVDLCTIINGRSGRCPENCKYCAQSAHNHTGVKEYAFMAPAEIVKHAQYNEAAGVNRFAIVTAGRRLDGKDFELAISAYETMHRTCKIKLCASMGFLTREQFESLKAVGVSRYHENIETSQRFFPEICTTHTYANKIESIKLAQEVGLSVCSGGIIGMGETWDDRLDMAISLAELKISSIPLNVLTPIKGTIMEAQPQLPPEDILRTVAFFRYINPTAHIRLAAGRKNLPDNGASAFCGGASATITGDMLTTAGASIKADREMFQHLGRTIQA